jgi:hypothetical protein
VAGSLVSVRAEGINTLARELVALGVNVEDLKDGFAAIADRGKQIAARHAPVGSGRDPHPGRLRDDIRGNRARNKAVVTSGRTSVPYAGAINYGWPAHNIEGAGYMQKVDTELGPFVPLILTSSINSLIRRRGLG